MTKQVNDDTKARAEAWLRAEGLADHDELAISSLATLLDAHGAKERQKGREGHHEPLGSWPECKRCTQFYTDDMAAQKDIAERDARIKELEQELGGIDAVLANIEHAIATAGNATSEALGLKHDLAHAQEEIAKLTEERDRWIRRTQEATAPGSLGAFAARDYWRERAEKAEAALQETRSHPLYKYKNSKIEN